MGATAASSGCLDRLRTIVGWQTDGQLSLRIKTVPADADPYALLIARNVAEWFRAAGIDASVIPMAEEELRRQVLLTHQFDVFVGRVPGLSRSPDALHPLLHSTGAGAAGWQNPFGYTNLQVDELLGAQRRATGDRRREIVADLLRTVARTQPFSVVGFPDTIGTARTDAFENWEEATLDTPAGFLAVEPVSRVEPDGTDAESVVRLVTTDERVTENLNPLAVEYRERGAITGLLYDPLVRRVGDRLVPWLAESVSFSDGEAGPTATVRLRPDPVWHDDAALTAGDVAFTYQFLTDTSHPDSDVVTPAPRFQGEVGLVTDARAVDDRRVEFAFVDCSRRVARRAFTVPILPAHVWEDRRDVASIGGIEVNDRVTTALVTNNVPPVGSGPVQFVRNNPMEALVLERFDDHFLHREAPPVLPGGAGAVAFEELALVVASSDVAAVSQVANGDADATALSVGAGVVPRIGREPDLELTVSQSAACYIVGYNARRQPLTNPRFRNLLGHLVDEPALVDDVFNAYAMPAATPLAGTDWVPPGLTWDGSDPVTPFYGTDGDLNVTKTREAFRAAGYSYDEDELVTR